MKRFKKIYIEITNVCNLNCDFCPSTHRNQEFMNIDTFTKILDQIKPYTDYIYLHVKGEPLLHPQLEKFLIQSGEKGFRTNITTNGTLINKVQDILLDKPSLRQLNFSLHSLDGNINFIDKQEYIYNILYFIKEAMVKSNVLISLRLWNLEENNRANIKNKKNNEILSIIEKEFKLNYKIEEKVVSGRGIKIADRVYLNQDQRFKWPDLNEKEESDVGFCYGLRNQIAILVDGTVIPCCLDGEGVINLGNINKTSFSEIINTKRANNLVEGFSKRQAVEELCRKCGYRSRFGGIGEIII